MTHLSTKNLSEIEESIFLLIRNKLFIQSSQGLNMRQTALGISRPWGPLQLF